jgi:hypothetical protein
MRTTTGRLALGLATVTLLALAACSGSGGDDAGTAGDAPAAEDRTGPAPAPADADSGGKTGGGDQATSVVLESPDLIKTATVRIVEGDLRAAREEIDTLLQKYGGAVQGEETVKDTSGRLETSALVLRVPSRSFQSMVDDLEESLDVRKSTTDTEDVHTQVIDVASRLTNLQVSLVRLRGFLRDATDLNAMLQFEQRITSVETQIASLTAQRDYLSDQTTMSTIHVDLRTPSAPPPPDDDPLDGAGFLTGLENGWNALKDVLVVTATAVGAALPFLVLGAVLGLPAWLVLRRRGVAEGPS